MSNLRHDLLTSGWSMIEAQKWATRINACWHELSPGRYESGQHSVIQSCFDEMSWLLHEALPEECFFFDAVEARDVARNEMVSSYWHTDGGYLRVLLTCQGDGTIAALGFENNIATPPGYALIITGQRRFWKTGICQTWHSGPANAKHRRLVLFNSY